MFEPQVFGESLCSWPCLLPMEAECLCGMNLEYVIFFLQVPSVILMGTKV